MIWNPEYFLYLHPLLRNDRTMKKGNFIVYLIRLCGILCMGAALMACQKEDVGPEDPGDTADTVSRTVLVYIAADNSLNSEGYENIRLMMAGIRHFSGHLAVYFDAKDAAPVLLNIAYRNGEAVQEVVREYEEEDSASPAVLSRVIKDTKRLFPAESYGLILWSHGLGWVPENFYFSKAFSLMRYSNPPKTKYFGEDTHPGKGATASTYMELKELGNALPDQGFTFIIFDACLMSCVELMYELKDKTQYIIASPAEILAAGFPYDKIMPYIGGGEEELKKICEEYYNYYNSQSPYPYATVALVKTSEMEALARETGAVLGGRGKEVALMDASGVWIYPTISSSVPLVYYDFGEYIKKIADKEQYQSFKARLDRTVIYKQATQEFWKAVIPQEKYSGLSTYIPLQRWENMNDFYFGLEWSKAVY